MEKNAKIYIAGHRGLVGSALLRHLIKHGYENIIVRSHSELDLTRQTDVEEFFRQERPEYVFLAAAKVGGINYNAMIPGTFMYDNLMIQTNVIDAAYRHGTEKLLFLGSACIYPKVTPQPIKEEYLLTAPLEPTNEGYALAKIAGLRMCQYYRYEHGFNAISVMPANLYGPNDNFDPIRCHVIPGMINKFYNAKVNNLPSVEFWGDGTPTREFLYVDDLADACVFLMKTYDSPQYLNIGSEVEIEIKELANIINKHIGYGGEIVWDSNKPNGTPRRKIDNQKLFDLGWRPKVSFDEGLKRTIDWFEKHKELYL
jgi:GDP-L-fucose synthase